MPPPHVLATDIPICVRIIEIALELDYIHLVWRVIRRRIETFEPEGETNV
jgi:hypothetical protein